jgi:hypothetical protein
MQVEVAVDTTTTTASADNRALVVISASASQAGVGTKFRDVDVPVMLLEPNVMAGNGFTADGMGARGTVAAQTALTIGAPTHALAAGLTGNVTVYTMPYRMVYGVPGSGAVKVATIVGNATQSPIFAYPRNAAMVGLTAPAKRIAFFMHNDAPPLTTNGTRLFQAAVDWAIAP